jgi:hypothetical protein
MNRRTHPLASRIAAAALLAIASTFSPATMAAEPVFKPVYDGVPSAPAAAQVLHSQDKGVFLENIVALGDGSFAITSLFDGRVLRLTGREVALWARVPGHASGIESDGAGGAWIGGWGKDERRQLWHVDAAGQVVDSIALPEAALPNGITRLQTGVLLVADSVKGLIWRVDLAQRKVSPWLADALLGGFDPEIKPAIPAVNGLKRHGAFLYASNMMQNHLVRIAIRPDGSAGAAEVYARDVFADDFAIDKTGRIFATTHVHNSVVSIDPTTRRATLLAGRAQGLQGATAVAIDTTAPSGTLRLVAVTNGGVYVPPAWGVEEARVVRIDVAATRRANSATAAR